MSPLRRIVRNERKRLVSDFKRDQHVSNKQLAAFCFMEKQPHTLNGKVNTIIELYIKSLEKQYEDKIKDTSSDENDITTNVEVSNG